MIGQYPFAAFVGKVIDRYGPWASDFYLVSSVYLTLAPIVMLACIIRSLLPGLWSIFLGNIQDSQRHFPALSLVLSQLDYILLHGRTGDSILVCDLRSFT